MPIKFKPTARFFVNVLSVLLIGYAMFIIFIAVYFRHGLWETPKGAFQVPEKKIQPGKPQPKYDLKLYREGEIDNLPYRDWKQKTDSMAYARSGTAGLSGGALVRLSENSYRLPSKRRDFMRDTAYRIEEYVILLRGWSLDRGDETGIDTTYYHVDSGVSYLRKRDWSNHKRWTYRSGGWTVNTTAHYYDQPVKFRYFPRDGSVGIPLKGDLKVLAEIHDYIWLAGALVVIISVIRLFLLLVIDISGGKPFTDKVVRNLRYIAVILLVASLFELPVLLLCRWIFNSYFVDDLHFTWNIMDGRWSYFFAGILFLALERAFRRGKKIAEENELTI